ncbi:MAG: hypothetical protein KTR32_13920 [Granulosicoccus sp.]|nr:hypothetical protein [Granulosicoccus sp.]
MFEFLFNYPVAAWRDAMLVFDTGWSITALGIAAVIMLIVIIVSLLRQPLSVGRRLLTGALQALAGVVLLLMLWQPALMVKGTEKGENTVAWVLDSSGSMSIEDVLRSRVSTQQSSSRYDAGVNLIESLAAGDEADFEASLYAIGDDLTTMDSIAAYANVARSQRTELASGIDTLLATVSDNALAAVVLISDGSDNSDMIDAQWWQSVAASGVPIHTVGVGKLQETDDLQLTDVSLPATAVPDAVVNARLRITHTTAGSARIRVFSGETLLVAEDLILPDGVSSSDHEVNVPTGNSGIRSLVFKIEPQDDAVDAGLLTDPNLENNRQPRILKVADDPQRILYVEGEPRWEYKFLRRALSEQPAVELVSLLRTSANKFYRQGVRDPSELADGFPQTRELLFEYDAIIIGSLEAAELSTAQQSALRDFVSIRGGSLLLIGGRHGLADGGWGRSVSSAALPVSLDSSVNARTFERARNLVRPTLAGYRTRWLKLAPEETANVSAWKELPALADIQDVGSVKPGAVVLLERESGAGDGQTFEPLLVSQRYGRGKSLVFGTSGTWRWQMGMPSEDKKHENFWQQLAAMLVDEVVPRIAIQSSQPVYRDVDSVALSVTAYNADYSALEQAMLPIKLTRPDGSIESLELAADPVRPGHYEGRVASLEDGPYQISAQSPLGGESAAGGLANAEHWWIRESGSAERFDTEQQRGFLERLADVTGGNYLAYEDNEQLNQFLAQKNAALVRELRLPLWNMPFFFLILFAAKSVEWLLRLRWKRL